MASAQVVETSVNTNNSPSQDYTTKPGRSLKLQHVHHYHGTFFFRKSKTFFFAESKVRKIKETFSKAGYPIWFIDKTVNESTRPAPNQETIPSTQWFDDRKSITLEIPFCKRNEDETKKLINKLTFFTQGLYKFRIVWRTHKIQSLFKLKDKTNHPSSVVYYGTCTSCKSAYVGESARNFSIRQAEHGDTRKFSEPARHSASHPGHTFQWKILAFASSWILRRTLEAIFIAKLRLNLNKQVHSFHLILFPNGIT